MFIRFSTVGRLAVVVSLLGGLCPAGATASPHAQTLELTFDFAAADDSVTALARLVPVVGGELPQATVLAGSAESDAVEFGAAVSAGGLELVPLVVRRSKALAPVVSVSVTGVASQRAQSLGAMGRFVAGRYGVGLDGTARADWYLIVVPDEFYSNVLPLAAWKERMGYRVLVRRTSEIGTTRDQIRAYIQTLYGQADSMPSFVLLVGSVNKMPAFTNAGTPCVTDHPYACVDGTDFLADLFVGRLPAANTSELDVMVAKVVGYESTPLLSDTSWYRRALMVGTSYQEGGTPAVTALVTKRLIRERLLGRYFDQIDTVFYPPTASGRGTVDTLVNRGVLFINGRGWGNYEGWRYPQFLISDVAGLQNGWRLPVITSIYCGTGNYQANPCFGEMWLRAGVPTNPRGGIAFWGSSYTGTSTRWNNCMDYGIYQAIFDFGNLTCGAAMYAGKLTQFENFPLPEDSVELRNYFHVYNLMGDPALQMWTGVPKTVTATYPGWVPEGTSLVEVMVRDGGGQPVEGALVCLAMSPSVHAVGRSDASGAARFALTPLAAGTLLVTVSGPNVAPYLGQIVVGAADVAVGYASMSPGQAGPGQVVSLDLTLRNYGGTQSATGISAVLRAADDASVVTDSTHDYGTMGPGATGSGSFGLTVAQSCTSGQRVPLSVFVSSGQGQWTSACELVIAGPTLKVSSYTVHDANGWLDPGESAELSVTLRNSGSAAANGLTAVLRSLSPNAIWVNDSAGTFGSIAAGDSGANALDRFAVTASPACGRGRRFSLRLVLRGSDGFEFLWDFPVTVGQPASTAPLGPDRHGYYAYDDTDAGYAERPTFDWVEVDPNYGGSGSHLVIANDTCVPVSLPFTFRYYGIDYGSISVSDNGFVAPGSQWIGDIYNWRIPAPTGTDGTIAPFWDDFRPDTLGASGVYTWHDAANHRFVVEWSRCVHVHGYRPPSYAEQQTFEVMLYDPLYHQTLTGDAPVVFQYLSIANDDTLFENNHNFATIGIESPDNTDGLEYTYANRYPATAAVTANSRAIRFTTNPPDTFIAVAETNPTCGTSAVTVSPVPAVTSVRFDVGRRSAGAARIFDVAGRRVRLLPVRDGEATWDLRDDNGQRARPGVYGVALTASATGVTIFRRFLICNQP